MDDYYNNYLYRMTMRRIDSEIDEFQDSEKTDGGYYLGNCLLLEDSSSMIMNISFSRETFFRHEIKNIEKAINWKEKKSPMLKIHIMKLNIVDDMYFVVLKTFWIRIIQRHWKKTFKARMQKNYFNYVRSREISSKPILLPSIVGMLSMYNKKLTCHNHFIIQ